jgi:hypothetical protein
MAAPSRLRWTLAGLALVALAVVVVWSGFGDGGENDQVRKERADPRAPSGATLEGREDLGGGAGLAPDRRDDAPRAELLLEAPDGAPAGGALVTCRVRDRTEVEFRGRADADGVVVLPRAMFGERCTVGVAEAPAWAQNWFDVWALGREHLRLSAGCQVWLEVGAADAGLLGSVLTYGQGATTRTANVASSRTLLGRFIGPLKIDSLGSTPAAASLQTILLPRSGEVTVRWQAAPKTRPARLRVRGPAGSDAAPQVTRVGDPFGEQAHATFIAPGPHADRFRGGKELAPPRVDGTTLVLEVEPGPHTLLAVAGDSWAFRRIDARESTVPEDVALAWSRGATLEVRLPDEPSGDVSLSVLRLADSERDLATWRQSPPQNPGAIEFDIDAGSLPAGDWPVAPRRESPTHFVWRGLPRGARVRVFAPTARWGMLRGYTALAADDDRNVLEVAPGARFMVRALSPRGAESDVWVTVTSPGYPNPQRTRTVGGEVVVTGLAPGAEAELDLIAASWRGRATVRVADGLEVRVPLVRRPMARYRARVAGESGRPRAGVGVSFAGSLERGYDVPTTVRTDADGWAEVEAASDRDVVAFISEPWYTGPATSVAAGESVTLTPSRIRVGRVLFDVGEQFVEYSVSPSGGDGTSTGSVHVFPGSVQDFGFGGGSTRLRVQVWSAPRGESRAFFDREFDLDDAPTTTLRVTR